MAIYAENPLTSTSTLAVFCLSSSAAEKIHEARQQDRELTMSALRELGALMNNAGIEPFDDGFYHGLVHPFDAHDLMTQSVEFTLHGDIIEAAGFRMVSTTGVGQMFLMGKSSDLTKLGHVWLLAQKDVPRKIKPGFMLKGKRPKPN